MRRRSSVKKGSVLDSSVLVISTLIYQIRLSLDCFPFFKFLAASLESEIHEHNCILSKVWYMPLFSDDRKCRRENLDQIIQGMYTETEGKQDGLIVIGRCNPQALKKLNQKYRSIVSVNRNSTNYEVDEVLCDGRKIASMALEHLISALGSPTVVSIGFVYCASSISSLAMIDGVK